jgi:hypothetical protein
MPTCKHCGSQLYKDAGVWADMTGGDVCPVNEIPVLDDKDPNILRDVENGPHEPDTSKKK